jgi:hypothetical protein
MLCEISPSPPIDLKPTTALRNYTVRFAAENGHVRRTGSCPLSAKSGHSQIELVRQVKLPLATLVQRQNVQYRRVI